MSHEEKTLKRWKFLLLIGRPKALIGLGMIAYGQLIDGPHASTVSGLGVLLLAGGFVTAWVGKIGGYWYHG